MYYIGIDLGGTGIKAGLVDEGGKIICKAGCPTLVERGARPIVDDMARLCREVAQQAGVSFDEVKAIGIGLPGIQDPRTGHVPFCTNLYWHEVPVIEWMQETIDKPIFIGNDATVAGLAESVAGVSAGVKNSVFITLGTGVGGGIVLDGKVYSGSHGVGSELGHMITVLGGEEFRHVVADPARVTGMALDGAGEITDRETARRLAETLNEYAALESNGTLNSGQRLRIYLDNGACIQMTVRNERLASCGVWSCPEFFEAFAAAAGL